MAFSYSPADMSVQLLALFDGNEPIGYCVRVTSAHGNEGPYGSSLENFDCQNYASARHAFHNRVQALLG